ncbi:hypothetical protein Pelo_12954 [Pelomyxa schiedti]|nr:hypothetical protein Pelo_12954 [Pelomyxa schiedti]
MRVVHIGITVQGNRQRLRNMCRCIHVGMRTLSAKILDSATRAPIAPPQIIVLVAHLQISLGVTGVRVNRFARLLQRDYALSVWYTTPVLCAQPSLVANGAQLQRSALRGRNQPVGLAPQPARRVADMTIM